MKQRVVVQAIVKNGDAVLLLRRSQGRPGLIGKYELPGGTLDNGEQPDDSLKRHLKANLGVGVDGLRLADAMSIVSREEGDIQHIFIIYDVDISQVHGEIRLGQSYDRYTWTHAGEVDQIPVRDSAGEILGVYGQADLPQRKQVSKPHKEHTAADALHAIIYSDGGSRGNPGLSAAAYVIMNSNQVVIDQGSLYLGITTNNQAEYHGVRIGLERALALGMHTVELRIDSMLVVNQLKGVYKVKNRDLWPINERITTLLSQFERVKFTHVPRELNQLADSLVNKQLDEYKGEIK